MNRDLQARMVAADVRYGPFASTHEALGVACEEWDELRDAIWQNDLARVKSECYDLAAVLMRPANQIETNATLRSRSVK